MSLEQAEQEIELETPMKGKATNLTIALEERRSFSASRIGRKKGIVCSRTIIFSKNDLLSSTQ